MIDNCAKLSAVDLAPIADLVAGHVTLEDVTRWALTQKPPRLFKQARRADDKGETEGKAPGFDVFVQDEYTHDVVVPYDAEGALYLVYDTT